MGHLIAELSAITAHQLALPKDMAFQGAFDIGLGRTGFEIRLCVERVELEKVAVRAAGRRTRAAVANFTEIISPLMRTTWQLLLLRQTFGEFACARWQVVQNPVHPRAYWRVGIVGNKSKAFRARWRGVPRELGRNVRAVACKFLGNHLTERKRGAGYLEGHQASLSLPEGKHKRQHEQ
jgi:hypothetical protein